MSTSTPAWIRRLRANMGEGNNLQDLYPGTPAYNARRSLFDQIEAEYPLHLRELVRQDLISHSKRDQQGELPAAGKRIRRKIFWEKMSCLIVYEFEIVAMPDNYLGDFVEEDERISMKWESLEDLAEHAQWIYCPMLAGYPSTNTRTPEVEIHPSRPMAIRSSIIKSSRSQLKRAVASLQQPLEEIPTKKTIDPIRPKLNLCDHTWSRTSVSTLTSSSSDSDCTAASPISSTVSDDIEDFIHQDFEETKFKVAEPCEYLDAEKARLIRSFGRKNARTEP